MGHPRSLTLATLSATAALATPAALASPTLQADRQCYTPGESITFSGGGYSPGGEVDFLFLLTGRYGSQMLTAREPSLADATGAIREVFEAPRLASSDDTQEQLVTTANDATRLSPGAPAMPKEETFGTTTVTLSIWDVFVPPWDRGKVDPHRRVKVSAYGYEPAKKLWAHYVLNGRRVKTVLVGRLKGPCGNLTKTMREFPFRPVRRGVYSVYFQGSRRLDKRIGTPYRRVRVTAAKAVP